MSCKVIWLYKQITITVSDNVLAAFRSGTILGHTNNDYTLAVGIYRVSYTATITGILSGDGEIQPITVKDPWPDPPSSAASNLLIAVDGSVAELQSTWGGQGEELVISRPTAAAVAWRNAP
jgi:hypothetical protein